MADVSYYRSPGNGVLPDNLGRPAGNLFSIFDSMIVSRRSSSLGSTSFSFTFGGGSRRIRDTRTPDDARLTDFFPEGSGRAMRSMLAARGYHPVSSPA